MGASPRSGILNVDKPGGWTSHDVVARVRRLTGERRVGHAGTLDPLATGVLLVCLGQATRVVEYLMAGQKRYRATLRLGITTDTYDADGQVQQDVGPVALDLAEVEAALAHLRGRVEQVPPMYSALKVAGQPLHRRARKGETVDRPARPVEIERLEILEWDSPWLTLDITCSPGTYIRSLAHDLGARLGCGAHVAALTRLSSGRFGLADAISMERLEEATQAGNWRHLLHPLDAALNDLPAVTMSQERVELLRHGQSVSCDSPPASHLARAYGPDTVLVAIVAYDPETAHWRPRKVFTPA